MYFLEGSSTPEGARRRQRPDGARLRNPPGHGSRVQLGRALRQTLVHLDIHFFGLHGLFDLGRLTQIP